VTLNAVAGFTSTLPVAIGSGDIYRFYVVATVTSNNLIIKVADATDTMVGLAFIAKDSADTVDCFGASGTDDTITLNGTTTGGTLGDFVELIDVATNTWSVRCFLTGTGTEATPFSATV
jgi:hypothetical protein